MKAARGRLASVAGSDQDRRVGRLLRLVGLCLAICAPQAASAQAPRQSALDTISELVSASPDRIVLRLIQRSGRSGDPAAREALIVQAVADYDRMSARAVAAHPGNGRIRLMRVQYLRSVGREADALALLAPDLVDVDRTARTDRWGPWLIDEAAFSLFAQGRDQEAIDLMARIVPLNATRNFSLFGPNINYSALLWQARRPAEAIAQLQGFMWEARHYASTDGWLWIASTQVCALYSMSRAQEAAALTERMWPLRMSGANAMTRALLCINDRERGEALLIERLRSARDVAATLYALQDFTVADGNSGLNAVLVRRLLALRERPRVRAEIDRVGFILRVPLARTYYGTL
jgi:hypothetical protein